MEVLHEAEHPRPLVTTGLLQTIHSRRWAVVGISNLVLLHAGVGELLLAIIEPPGGQGGVGQEDEAKQSDHASHCTLDNEEPMGFISKPSARRRSAVVAYHRHPAMPLSPSMPAKTPAAISPDRPVARI